MGDELVKLNERINNIEFNILIQINLKLENNSDYITISWNKWFNLS